MQEFGLNLSRERKNDPDFGSSIFSLHRLGLSRLQKDHRSETDAAARFTTHHCRAVRPAETEKVSIFNLWHLGQTKPLGGMPVSTLADSTD